ncbi:MAG: ribonuclease Z [Psychroflexus maritimus]
MQLTILGCHSASPKSNAHPTAQILEVKGHLFLIDCGEGTQVRLRQQKVKFSRLKHIFISHLHGDHVFGLMGLLTTFGLLNRKESLCIHGPKGIKEFVEIQLKLSASFLSYKLNFNELTSTTSEVIFEDDLIKIKTLPLLHRVYTNGFHFQEKPGERKLNYQKAVDLKINPVYFNKLKQSKNVISETGEEIDFQKVTEAPDPPKSYSFCSDTSYNPKLIPLISYTNLLYHESTFLASASHEDLAHKTGHSTATEAALIARKAKAKHLLLGHFSARYKDLNLFVKEAQEIFEPASYAYTGLKVDIE